MSTILQLNYEHLSGRREENGGMIELGSESTVGN